MRNFMRKIFYSDGRCADDGFCDMPDMHYEDYACGCDGMYRCGCDERECADWGHKKCHDCICRVCGCRDMTVECSEHCSGGGNCLFWAVLTVLTGGLALIFPLLRGGNNCRTDCVAVCRRCGHRQPIC